MVAVTPHVRVLPTHEDNAFSMEPALLEAAIKEDLAAGDTAACISYRIHSQDTSVLVICDVKINLAAVLHHILTVHWLSQDIHLHCVTFAAHFRTLLCFIK